MIKANNRLLFLRQFKIMALFIIKWEIMKI